MLNLFIVWFLTGFWHGASWNFIFWGLYFGVFILIERLFLGKLLEKLPRFFSHLYALPVIVISWGIFYFTDFARLKAFFTIIFGFAGHALWDLETQITFQNHIIWLALACIFCIPVIEYIQKAMERRNVIPSTGLKYAHVALNAGLLIASVTLLVGKSYNPFIYFRF